MSIVRIGTTKKYANNWGLAFGKKPPSPSGAPAKKAAAKKAPKKKSAGGKGK